MMYSYRIWFSPILSLLLCVVAVQAQQVETWNETDNLPRRLTESEKERIHEIGKDFIASARGLEGVRNISEFERMEGVLIRYPLGIPEELVAAMSEHVIIYTLVANQTRLDQALNAYANAGVQLENCEFVMAPTNSIWTRDYGPWFVATEDKKIEIVDFKYNRPRPLDDAIPTVMADYLEVERHGMDLIHCGGNYMSDSYGIGASTDLVLEENGFDEAFINNMKFDYLGIHTYHVTEDAQGEYIRHIDTWAKFLDVDKILIAQVPELSDRYPIYEAIAEYYAGQMSSYGTPFQVYRVFSPQGQPYTNSLILNERVYVPTTGSAWDEDALNVYREAMPGYEILGFRGSWVSTDALHCRIKDLADRNMLYISHTPIATRIDYRDSIQINAKMMAYGTSVLDEAKSYLIYSRNQTDFDTLTMTNFAPDQFTTHLLVSQGDTLITYYFSVADTSGKVEQWPLVGKEGARSFRLAYRPDLAIYPDTLFFDSVGEAEVGLWATVENRTPVAISIDSCSRASTEAFPWMVGEGAFEEPLALGVGEIAEFRIYLPEGFEPPLDELLSDSLILYAGEEQFSIPIYFMPEQTSSTLTILEEVENVQVFPNPFVDAIQVSFDRKAAGDIQLRLLDTQGKVWGSEQISMVEVGSQTYIWSGWQNIPAGMYFLEMTSASGSLTTPVVKSK